MSRNDKHDSTVDAHLPLSAPTFRILMSLIDGERHGYAIMQHVNESADGGSMLGPGTLYGSLKRLLEAGLVKEIGERVDPELGDERRRYYQISKLGLKVARAEAMRLQQLVQSARRLKLIGPERA